METTNTQPAPGGSIIQSHPHHIGPVLGVMLIALVLVLGGLYLWGASIISQTTAQAEAQKNTAEVPTVETKKAEPASSLTLSNSNQLQAIEEDIERIDYPALDAELDQAEFEMDALLKGI